MISKNKNKLNQIAKDWLLKDFLLKENKFLATEMQAWVQTRKNETNSQLGKRTH